MTKWEVRWEGEVITDIGNMKITKWRKRMQDRREWRKPLEEVVRYDDW